MSQTPKNHHHDPRYAIADSAAAAARETHAEPLHEAQLEAVLARVQREVQTPARRNIRWWAPAMGTGLAAMAATAALLVFRTPTPVAIEHQPVAVLLRSGEVKSQNLGNPVGAEASSLPPETELELGEGARTELHADGLASLSIQGPASIRGIGTSAPTLKSGAVDFRVPKRQGRAPYTVHFLDAQVTVLGTDFAIAAQEGLLTSVTVREGVVEVKSNGPDPEILALLRAGDHYSRPGTPEPQGEPTASPFDSELWREPRLQQGHAWVEATPKGTHIHYNDSDLGPAPLLVALPPGNHRLKLLADGYQSLEQEIEVRDGDTTRFLARLDRVALDAPTASAHPIAKSVGRIQKAQLKSPSTDKVATLLGALACEELDTLIRQERISVAHREDQAQTRLTQAECWLRRGDKGRARALYEEIAARFERTAAGETALFESAKLQTEAGELDAALSTLRRYRSAYPKGPFAELAAFRECELLVQQRTLSAARECLVSYQKTFHGGPRATESVLLLATIARVQEHWQEAAELYGQYADSKNPQRLEEALYQRFVCLRRGNLPGLNEARADYLQRFPAGPRRKDVEK